MPDDYYVDAQRGLDTSAGTASSPWRSLRHACESVRHAKPAVIHLAAGVFALDVPCVLSRQTSLIGAGADQTTITSTIRFKPKDGSPRYGDPYFSIQSVGAEGVSIGGFTIEGQIDAGHRAHGGILVRNASRIHIHDLELNHFEYTALWVTDTAHLELDHIALHENGDVADPKSTVGNMELSDLIHGSIHDIRIRETRGAYGIKAWKFGWTSEEAVRRLGAAKFTDVRFHHLDIKLRTMGAYDGGSQPNFPLELWNCELHHVEIDHSVANGTLSIPELKHGTDKDSIRIDHNVFVGDNKAFGREYAYFIEASANFMTIDHNLFVNGVYPIASFGTVITGLTISDNTFYNVNGVSVLNFNRVSGLVFARNTVVLTSDVRAEDLGHLPLLRLAGGASRDVAITENTLVDQAGSNDGPLVKLDAHSSITGTVARSGNRFSSWTDRQP